MKINEKHSAIMMERVFDCKDEYELIDLVSGRDKRRIPIHRVIFMAASKYFAELFRTNDMIEKPKEFIIDSSGEVIDAVVNFCYSGHIDLTEENVESCVKIATESEMDLLLNECHHYLTAKLSTETVVNILLIAADHNLNDIQQRASALLCSNLERVSATHILQLHPGMMSHLLENADEAVSSDLLAERLVSWYRFAEAERGEHMPKLLRLIRLEKLTAEFLCDTIEPLFKQFKCTELLYDEFKRRVKHPKPCNGCLSIDDKEATIDKTGVFLVGIKLGYICYRTSETLILIVERYDASFNTFTLCSMSPLIHDGHTSYNLYDSKVYATGDHPNIAYDVMTGKGEKLLPMNKQRFNHTSILMGKSLYVFGGHDGNDYVGSCERYDTEKKTWQTIKSMSRRRSRASAAILNGLIYVVGGYESSQTCSGGTSSTLVESYDPKTDQWTERMAIDVTSTYWGPLVAFNGMLYAFVKYRGVREYDPDKNIWTMIENDYNFESVVSANGSMLAVTTENQIGQVTINERKIVFAERTQVEHSKYDYFRLQQCRAEE